MIRYLTSVVNFPIRHQISSLGYDLTLNDGVPIRGLGVEYYAVSAYGAHAPRTDRRALPSNCSVFLVRNRLEVCGNIGLNGRLLSLIADQKSYQKARPD
jgi:hypothetical protein